VASTDRFAVYAVTGAGETLLFEEIDDNSNSHPGVWKSQAIDLSAFAGQTIRIKFLADDDVASGVLVEAQVDDLRVCYVIDDIVNVQSDVEYEYDARGRLIRISNSSGQEANYILDDAGNRLEVDEQLN